MQNFIHTCNSYIFNISYNLLYIFYTTFYMHTTLNIFCRTIQLSYNYTYYTIHSSTLYKFIHTLYILIQCNTCKTLYMIQLQFHTTIYIFYTNHTTLYILCTTLYILYYTISCIYNFIHCTYFVQIAYCYFIHPHFKTEDLHFN